MEWTLLDTWIVTAGVLCATSCALLGSFLVLRRMSMMGDAISHAVLPGLAIAFLIANSRASLAMFIGAAIVGVLTTLLTQWIHTLGKVDESASMGVVFTTMFAIGLVLIVRAADSVDLDPGCVLYGAIELTPLDTVLLFGLEVPRAVVMLSGALLLNLLFVALFYKELRITTFDPALATTVGIHANRMNAVLMTLVAVTTVASFESVGSILVIAMLIVPAATAHLLTDRYLTLLILSVLLAGVSAALGHVAAITVPTWFGFPDTTTAGMMAVVVGLMFGLAMLAAPRHGIVSKIVHRLALSLRIAREDVLGRLYRAEEAGVGSPQPGSQAALPASVGLPPVIRRLALWRLQRSGRIVLAADVLRLTEAGRHDARQLVRAHRLWESYLAKHFELPTDHLHESAERAEHFISDAMNEAMADDLQDVHLDPHGKVIPGREESEGTRS